MLSDDSIHILSDYTTNSVFQYMVDGVNTEIGVIAVLNVEEEVRIALGPALTLLHNMVVMSVRERLRIHRLVMNILVQVRKSFGCEWKLKMLMDTSFNTVFAELNKENSVS